MKMGDELISPAAVAAPPSSSGSIAEVPTTTSGAADPSQNLQETAKDESDANLKDASEKQAFKVTDQTNILPARQVVPVFLGLVAAILVSTLDQSIVSTAIPTIAAHFNAG